MTGSSPLRGEHQKAHGLTADGKGLIPAARGAPFHHVGAVTWTGSSPLRGEH